MSFLDDGLRVTVNGINGLGKGVAGAGLKPGLRGVGMFCAIHPMLDAKHQARARPAPQGGREVVGLAGCRFTN